MFQTNNWAEISNQKNCLSFNLVFVKTVTWTQNNHKIPNYDPSYEIKVTQFLDETSYVAYSAIFWLSVDSIRI